MANKTIMSDDVMSSLLAEALSAARGGLKTAVLVEGPKYLASAYLPDAMIRHVYGFGYKCSFEGTLTILNPSDNLEECDVIYTNIEGYKNASIDVVCVKQNLQQKTVESILDAKS
jgi:hypothetical protein